MVSQQAQMGGYIYLYKPLLSAISPESFPKREDHLLTDFRKKNDKKKPACSPFWRAQQR